MTADRAEQDADAIDAVMPLLKVCDVGGEDLAVFKAADRLEGEARDRMLDRADWPTIGRKFYTHYS